MRRMVASSAAASASSLPLITAKTVSSKVLAREAASVRTPPRASARSTRPPLSALVSTAAFLKEIRDAKTIFANGPAGVFEDPRFSIGTEDLINAIASSKGFSLIGGGHIAAATAALGCEDQMSHVSSGGGACISMLAGKKLAAVEALKNSKK